MEIQSQQSPYTNNGYILHLHTKIQGEWVSGIGTFYCTTTQV